MTIYTIEVWRDGHRVSSVDAGSNCRKAIARMRQTSRELPDTCVEVHMLESEGPHAGEPCYLIAASVDGDLRKP